MKKSIALLVFISLFVTAEAHARAGVQYILPKVSAIFYDGNPEWKKPLYTVGAYWGYGFDTAIAVEVEGNYGVSGGNYTENGANGSFSAWDINLYGVYRYKVLEEGYLKGKVGTSYAKIDHIPASGDDLSSQDFGVVIGGGFGYVFKSSITFELEYTRLKNISHNLGLGLHYQF